MKKKEKTIETYLKKYIESRGGLCIKLIPSFFTGLPDRLVLMPGGKLFFVELKADSGVLSARQRHVQKVIESLGFKVYNINTIEIIDSIFI